MDNTKGKLDMWYAKAVTLGKISSIEIGKALCRVYIVTTWIWPNNITLGRLRNSKSAELDIVRPVEKKCVSCSAVSDSATPWTIAHQAPPSMGVSRQECWSGLPFSSPGDLPNRGLDPGCPRCRQALCHLSRREAQQERRRGNERRFPAVLPSCPFHPSRLEESPSASPRLWDFRLDELVTPVNKCEPQWVAWEKHHVPEVLIATREEKIGTNPRTGKTWQL